MAELDTRTLYELFPYPSPDVDGTPIRDTAIGIALLLEDDRLQNWRVLDLGCGTGHRLIAMALQYPDAQFTGVDPSKRSLEVAQDLANRNRVTNVRFIHGSIPQLVLPEMFDLIVSTGVLHHIPRPHDGVRWAVEHLGTDGLFYLWLYGALGEHHRMLDRELVHLLAGDSAKGPDLETVRALGLKLSHARYGPPSQGGGATSGAQASLDADAYLNPIVQPLTFAEVAGLFEGLMIDWVAANGLNMADDSRLIDLAGVDRNSTFTVSARSLFEDTELRRRFDALERLDRARVLELRLQPTGISVVAGRGSSLEDCTPRVRGNILVRPTGAPDL